MRIDWVLFDEQRADGLLDETFSLDLDTGAFDLPKDGAPGRWVRVLEGVRASDLADLFYDRERFELLQSWLRCIDECADHARRDAMRAALLRWQASPGSERKETRRAFRALVDPETNRRYEAEEAMRWRSDFLRWLARLPVPVEEPPPWAAEVERWRTGRQAWALDPALVDEAERFVRGGFWEPWRIVTMLCEETHRPGEVEPWVALAAVGTAVAAVREEQLRWPSETDCDRLDRAFATLRDRGFVALQNAGNTQSDGYDDVREALARAPQGNAGYCFYHQQDLEGAIAGRGLHLAFGPIDPRQEQTHGPEVGRQIVAVLHANGLQTRWNGTFEQRIAVTPFDWKKRGPLSND